MSLPPDCIHCGLPISQGERLVEEFEGKELHFCCRGCLGAYSLITGAGLTAFYRKRSWDKPGLPDGAFEAVYSDTSLAPFVSVRDGRHEIALLISGIRCSACIWLIESILARIPGVEEARVNYGTHRGRVRFDPARTSAAAIFEAVAGLGYAARPFSRDTARAAQEKEAGALLIRFGTAVFLSMQLMGYSIALYGGYFRGMDPGTRQLMQYFAALVSTPVVFFSGAPFLKGAWRSLRNRAPDMDLLIALGVLVSYIYSLVALVIGGEVYFETAAMIVTLILLGRLLESVARKKAMAGVDMLLNLVPDTARLVHEEGTVPVTGADLKVGDIIELGPGDRFPVDCTLVGGDTEVDESILTGEADPVPRGAGAMVLAGSMNLACVIRARVVKAAADSFMARVALLVEEAQDRRAPVQRTADRVAAVFVPAVIILALATCIFWLASGAAPAQAFMYGVAVLVVACPCALGLATPTAILVGTGVSAAAGIIFRGGDTMEQTARLTVAVFDKTGTLTDDLPKVTDIHPVGTDRISLLTLAARAESGSNHPLARGIRKQARQEGIHVRSTGGEIMAGRGVRLESDQGTILAGSRRFMRERGIEVPARSRRELTEVHVALQGVYQGCLYLSSRVRPEAVPCVRELVRLGLRPVLLTGDHLDAAREVAAETGISEVHAEMSPEAKGRWIRQCRGRGEVVLMVGDGVNDAPALSEADVGCAMGSGTDLALETSDLILVGDALEHLAPALNLARRTLAVIRQNLFWAFSYNLVAIPLAMAGKLAPVYAAAAMAISSVCVVANSLRLGVGGNRVSSRHQS